MPPIDPFVRRSHVAVCKWIQLFGKRIIFHKCRATTFLVNGTYVRVGTNEAWVWVAVEPIHGRIREVYLSRFGNIMVAEFFLDRLVGCTEGMCCTHRKV
jgi:transposase-like protein